MTFRPAPALEGRTGDDIRVDIYRRLADARCADGSAELEQDGPVDGLVRVFARYWDIVAARLNAALDKNFLAYLDYLGVAPIPATSARVPLTFSPVDNAPPTARVPQSTQVAAAAAEGEAEPVVFETVAPLALTTARLRHVFSLDPARNTQRDMPEVADATALAPVPVFAGGEAADHAVFIGDGVVFGLKNITTLTVRFDLEGGPPAGEGMRVIQWSIPTKEGDVLLVPSADGTRALRESGDIVFDSRQPWPAADLFGRRSRWLVGRLTGVGAGNWSVAARCIELRAEVMRTDVPIETATGDSGDVDLTKDFYPFGLRPVFGSTVYFASTEAFSHPGASVTLDVRLTNPHNAVEEPPIPRVHVDGHPRVRWEYWNGRRWTRLEETDGTSAFRANGSISFQIPEDFAAAEVRGRTAFWVRARLASGHYGEDPHWDFESPEQPAAGMRFRRGTLAPPSIQTISASYTLALVRVPDFVVTSNEGVHEDWSIPARKGLSFPLFGFPCGARPALYLGFLAAEGSKLAGQVVNLYVLAETAGKPFVRSGASELVPDVRWQFWNGTTWQDGHVHDETNGFTREGGVSMLVPEEARQRSDFVERSLLFWLRAVRRQGTGAWLPAVRGILLNTVPAAHKTTVRDEVLGSSHGEPDQRFSVLRTPVLEGEVLEVAEMISARELRRPHRTTEVPPGELVEVGDERDTTRSGGLWVRWHAVDSLADSDPHSRHYVLDRTTGEVVFGDGRHGLVPPAGVNNIRLRQYQAGGGARGNKRAGEVTQLRSSVPYVDSVVNRVEATGGADAEPLAHVRRRGATLVRHGSRAVTAEDYEDMARLASSQVARADCVPLRDLAVPPAARSHQPGMVSVIVIPSNGLRMPSPDGELLRCVGSYLDRHRNVSTDLVVVGPDYVEVSVRVELVVSDAQGANTIASRARTALEGFLHPVWGGPTRNGWRLGQLPERRDVYAMCASVDGVLYVRGLAMATSEQRPGVMATRHFLVASGDHHVSVRHVAEDEGLPGSAAVGEIGGHGAA